MFVNGILIEKTFITVGHVVTEVNKHIVDGSTLSDGTKVLDYLEEKTNYPITLKFERKTLTTNEKLILTSMFHPMFDIASQLSPEPGSSGIEVVEAESFKLHCFQSLTGKFTSAGFR